MPSCRSPAVTCSSTPPQPVDRYGADDDGSGYELLELRIRTEEDQTDTDNPDEEGADYRAHHRSLASKEVGAAEDDRRDRGKLHPSTHRGITCAGAPREEQAGERRKQAGDDEADQHHPLGVDTGVGGRAAIAARGVHPAPVNGLPEDEDSGQHHEGGPQHRYRDSEQRAGAKHSREGDGCYGDGHRLGQHQSACTDRLQHPEGYQERRHADVRRDQAVEGPDPGADCKSDQDGRKHRPAVRHQDGCQGAREADSGADREIDLAVDDDQSHADRDDGYGGRLAPDVRQRAASCEGWGIDREEGDDPQEDDVDDRLRAESLHHGIEAPAKSRTGPGGGRCCADLTHAASPLLECFWMARLMAFSSLAASLSSSPTTCPSASTRIRSQIAASSSASEEL